MNSSYFSDTLSFAKDTLTDRELVFEFYDKQDKLLKYETIIVLTGADPIQWPALKINTSCKDLEGAKNITIDLGLTNPGIFKLSKDLRYVFQHHIGWEPGEGKTIAIDPKLKEQALKVSYEVKDKSLVLGIYAGTEIKYGKFVKTIFDEKFIYRGNWADAVRIKQ
jgi:hypothetical protein